MENIRQEETATEIIPPPYVCILRKMKRINSIFVEFSMVANNPVCHPCRPSKVSQVSSPSGAISELPHWSTRTLLWACSLLSVPTKTPPALVMDLCPREIICFLRTWSVAYSFQCSWCQAHCRGHKAPNKRLCEWMKKLKALLCVKI